jgi:hypothetical protein
LHLLSLLGSIEPFFFFYLFNCVTTLELSLNLCIHMPNRADAGHSPPGDKSDFKVDVDDPIARMSDIALRKKKNADAQAAFRQR